MRRVLYWGADLVYSTDRSEAIKENQKHLGLDEAGTLVDRLFAAVVKYSVADGVRKIIVVGGETSGSVVQSLDIEALAIGPAVAPGSPGNQDLE